MIWLRGGRARSDSLRLSSSSQLGPFVWGFAHAASPAPSAATRPNGGSRRTLAEIAAHKPERTAQSTKAIKRKNRAVNRVANGRQKHRTFYLLISEIAIWSHQSEIRKPPSIGELKMLRPFVASFILATPVFMAFADSDLPITDNLFGSRLGRCLQLPHFCSYCRQPWLTAARRGRSTPNRWMLLASRARRRTCVGPCIRAALAMRVRAGGLAGRRIERGAGERVRVAVAREFGRRERGNAGARSGLSKRRNCGE
jgi:hypothetical protein